MSHKFVSALIIMALISICLPAWAQDGEAKTHFRLLRDSATAAAELELEEEAAELWVPGIEGGNLEISFFLGFLDLKKTLLAHDQIIYKYTDEATFWGDMTIEGETAFNPGIRVGYNVNKWFALEGVSTLSISEYSSSVTNRSRRPNEPGSLVDFNEPTLGEFDLESRSLITGSFGANAVVYPFNVRGEGKGRLQPFLTGGFSALWYNMNSNYTDGSAGTVDLNLGGGIRLLADRNISIRLEVQLHANSVEFTPAENFRVLNEGTTEVPLNEYPIVGENFNEQGVSSFSSQTLSYIGYSIGVQADF